MVISDVHVTVMMSNDTVQGEIILSSVTFMSLS